MDALRVPPGDAEIRTLSGGEKRRVALCRLLLSRICLAVAARRGGWRHAEVVPETCDGYLVKTEGGGLPCK